MGVTTDPITEIEEYIEATLREKLPDYHLSGKGLIVSAYGGEFGAEDLLGVLETMVGRGSHALVAYMGEEDREEFAGAQGQGVSITARWSVYIAARNLRSEAEQKREAYPLIVATKRILRAMQPVAFEGQLGPERWVCKLETVLPAGDSPTINVPGLVCFQVNFTSNFKLIWQTPQP